jgi:hypothetical protein|tara:strand:- start:2479 stop:5862 length:3384 start_codon:yes stop_codon:yes gene_type:complete
MNYQIRFLLFSLLFIGTYSCTDIKSNLIENDENPLFERLDSVRTQVTFVNKITTNDTLNILNFENIYLGGGIGIGDFNADGLPDLFFVGNMVPSRLYLNKGNFKFEDITIPSKIQVHGWAYGVSVADVNADGLDDIYLSIGGVVNKEGYKSELFINQGNDENGIPSFKEEAEFYGLADLSYTIQSVFFDFDKDGDLDMYKITGGSFERSPIIPYPIKKDGSAKSTDRLYRNDFNDKLGHPVFTDISKQANILEEGYGLGVSILDIDEDGWSDIYVTNDYLTNDLLYINNRDGTFKEASQKYFNHTSHFAMGNDTGDINNDGLIDIVAVDMLPDKRKDRMQMLGVNNYDKFYYAQKQGYSSQYMRNTLQLNNGLGKFSEIGQMAGIFKTSWSWGPLLADFDNDGYLDLFITNGFGKDVTDLDFVKFRSDISPYSNTNNKNKERDFSLLKAIDNQPGIKTHPYMYKNMKNNTFENVSNQWDFNESVYSSGSAYVDLDNDGDLDIVTNNIDAPAHLYKNKTNDEGAVGVNNFLRVKLNGPSKNKNAIGSKIRIKYNENIQYRFLSRVRGFESTVEQTIHYGLGKESLIDTLIVTWPDDKKTILTNIKANQVLNINYSSGNFTDWKTDTSALTPYFASISPASIGIDFKDKHLEFNDFTYERLIPRKYSENGQNIAVGDVNGDALEDFFVGGGFQQTGKLYIQDEDGHFTGSPISKLNDGCVDSGSLFFDADGDGDLDLYVVSGGNQLSFENVKYQDRLYINDGKGNFLLNTKALPIMLSSGSCISAADFDNDGDLDLFLGGGVKPGYYPQCSKSYLLRNEGGRFVDVTDILAKGLQNIGIVTSALWTDFDNDNKVDLIVAGEWMPITVFKNNGKSFKNHTEKAGLANSNGWWQSLESGDFDHDGDMDFVAGNWGLNTPFRCSTEEPMSLYFADFDKNGKLDPIFSCYEDGKSYPVPSLDYMVEQMPILKKKFLHYSEYSSATTDELIEMFDVKNFPKLYCKTLASTYLKNNGDGTFDLEELPQAAQVAPLFDTKVLDINKDGNLDILGIGNFYWTDVVIGKYDALKGLTMLGDGLGNFKTVDLDKSGFVVDSDARTFATLKTTDNQSLFIVSQILDSLKIFKQNKIIKRD